jgi:hypothetical protein
MRVYPTLILADAAQDVGGKLYILGGGWTITNAPTPPSAVAVYLRLVGAEQTRNTESGSTWSTPRALPLRLTKGRACRHPWSSRELSKQRGGRARRPISFHPS